MRSLTISPMLTALRSALSMTPAAAICSSTTPPGRCCATRTSGRNRKNAATIPTACRHAMRGSPLPRCKPSPPTWQSPCIPVAVISARPSSPRAAMTSSPSNCWATPISTATFSNMTATAPAGSSRCGSFPEAKSSSCSGWSHRRPARSRTRTRSSGASTKPRNMWRWINCVCRRNAASLRPRKATSSPRRSNGRSCG